MPNVMTSKPDLLPQYRIVLCQTSHPGNIGAAARAMKTMGLSQLYLVQPRKFPHADATAMATGAADLLEQAVICTTLAEALAGCAFAIGLSARRRELSHELVTVREAAAEAAKMFALSNPTAAASTAAAAGVSAAKESYEKEKGTKMPPRVENELKKELTNYVQQNIRK